MFTVTEKWILVCDMHAICYIHVTDLHNTVNVCTYCTCTLLVYVRMYIHCVHTVCSIVLLLAILCSYYSMLHCIVISYIM